MIAFFSSKQMFHSKALNYGLKFQLLYPEEKYNSHVQNTRIASCVSFLIPPKRKNLKIFPLETQKPQKIHPVF